MAAAATPDRAKRPRECEYCFKASPNESSRRQQKQACRTINQSDFPQERQKSQ
jgi:hypothetical protein